MNELRIPTLPDGVQVRFVGEEVRLHKTDEHDKNYALIERGGLEWELAKWVPKDRNSPDKGDYEIVGEYESAQAALDVAAAFLFLGEIDYGYD